MGQSPRDRSSLSGGFLRQQSRLALLDALRTLDVHNHIALIYESQVEQFDAALPFVKIGLSRNEKCVYITDDNAAGEVIRAGTEYGIDVDAALETGALTVTDPSETYLRDGSFDPDDMFEYLADAEAEARDEGYTALRAMGEMTWQLGGGADEDLLLEYEAKLNQFLDDHDALAICQYNRERFDPTVLQEVIRTHPELVYGYTVARNYYFVPPEEYLDPDPEREFERMLTDVVERDRLQQRLADREDQQKVLSNVVRHNIRNEMNVVAGYAEQLSAKEGGRSPEAEIIIETAEELVQLSQQAQEIERTLERIPNLRSVELEPLLTEQVESIRSRYPDAEIALDVADDVTALALPSLDRALDELVSNAVKHNDRETPRVDVSVTKVEGAVDVSVADDGPHISEMEVQTLIKEREIEPLYHGSGLGLWLVHWIVSRSNGKLLFDEREPRGNVVTVRLATVDF